MPLAIERELGDRHLLKIGQIVKAAFAFGVSTLSGLSFGSFSGRDCGAAVLSVGVVVRA